MFATNSSVVYTKLKWLSAGTSS